MGVVTKSVAIWRVDHSFRPVDVAEASRWSDLTSLRTAHQHPDMDTLYKVVSEPAELEEANG